MLLRTIVYPMSQIETIVRRHSLCLGLLAGIGFVLFPHSLSALDPGESTQQYNCRTWTRQNGLPVDGLQAITQTKDGFLWLGTQKRLSVFDGIDFTLVELPDQSRVRRQAISGLVRAQNGGLWFGI